LRLAIIWVFSFAFGFNLYCQDTTFFYYPDGRISAKGLFKNGKPHGIWYNYYENGILKSKGKRLHGMLDSTWTFYFEDGEIKEVIQYAQNVRNGYYFLYSKNPVHHLQSKSLFVDGKLQGQVQIFSHNGVLKEKVPYRNGVKNGEGKLFDSVGKLKATTIYRNNKRISHTDSNYNIGESDKMFLSDTASNYENTNNYKLRSYTIEGLDFKQFKNDSVFKGRYINKKPVGEHYDFDSLGLPCYYYYYDSAGFLQFKVALSDYKFNGKVYAYYGNRNILYTGFFINDKKWNEWVYYFENQQVEQKGYYRNDLQNGTWIWFYKNGDTLQIQNFRNGRLDGQYLSYDPYGNVIQKGYYENGLKQGYWVENSGFITHYGNYLDGEKDGNWNSRYENGKLAFKGAYIRGQKHSKHIYYYNDGTIRLESKYEHGRSIGFWKYFDSNGKLYKVKSFGKKEQLFIKD